LLRSALPGHVIEDHPRTFSSQFSYPVIGYGGSYYPSLAIQAYRRFVNLPMDAFEVNFGESLNIGSLYLPTDNQMRLAINFHGPGGSYKRTRFGDLLEGDLPADRFKDKLILVGLNSSIATDTVSTPFDQSMSKVEFLANVIDNINRMNPLIRSQQVVVLDILLLALIGLFFALVAAARSMWAVLTLAVIAVALFVAADVQAFILFNLWLGLTFPLLAMILCTAVLMMAKHVSKNRRAALKAQEEAEETQFATPWTFDRVAKTAVEEMNPSLDEGEEDSHEVEPLQKEANLVPAAEEKNAETAMTPEPEPSAETEKKDEEPAAENVTPFPSPKPSSTPAAGPAPLPVPPPTTQQETAKTEVSSSTIASKPRKPASLIPVMEASASSGKVSLTSASERTRPSAAQDEFEIAVLFINMSGFMKLAKSFGPTRSAQFLHAVYQLIEKTVAKHGGFMEQFAEDDVMALFGLPESSSEDASNGLRAARELASVLSDWGEQQGFDENKSAKFCICADYGPVKVHLGGTEEEVVVSLSGHAIGLASRLDKTVAAKGAGIVVSEKLMTKVSETDLTGQLKDGFTEQPLQQVPGGAESVGLWRSEAGAL
jgi:class 3 adenylate cyclase